MKTSHKILLSLLLAATLSCAAVADTASKQVFTSKIRITTDLPCGKTEQVFAYLRDTVQMSPLYSSVVKVSEKETLVTGVWFSTWSEDNKKNKLVITESTAAGLTCISESYINVKQVDPGIKM